MTRQRSKNSESSEAAPASVVPVRAITSVVLGIFSAHIALAQPPAVESAAPPVETTIIDRKAEYNVKGAYLYNFARYVTWPAHSEMPRDVEFHIGVLGDTGVVHPLKKIAKYKKITERQTGISKSIRIHEFATPQECKACQILFVSEATSATALAEVVEKFADLPVMIVGETDGFVEADGTAEFLLVGSGIRFDLNLDTANEKNLKLDAKLLKAANSITQKDQGKALTQNQ